VDDVPEDRIIDATKRGGNARYINHSCDPNCAPRITKVGGAVHVDPP
jgi:histone-lysine N-methyltransferase SETD1